MTQPSLMIWLLTEDVTLAIGEKLIVDMRGIQDELFWKL